MLSYDRLMQSLQLTLRDLVDGFPGHCALALTDVGTGEYAGIDEEVAMAAASVIKVPVLAALFRAEGQGRLSLEGRVTPGPRQEIEGSGVVRYLSPDIEMTLRDAAILMTIVSDNPAFEMCLDALGGVGPVNEISRELGLANTLLRRRLTEKAPTPDGREFAVTTAADMCRLFAMVARSEVISRAASRDMLGMLRCQQSHNKLARYLAWSELGAPPGDPKRNWIASKDGVNAYHGVRNDAAIVCRDGRLVAVAAFTEFGDHAVTGEHPGDVLLGRIGEAIWDWLGENSASSAR